MKTKVYLSSALASSLNISLDQAKYEALALLLEDHNCDVYLPHKKFNPSDPTHSNVGVYRGDLESLLSSNIVIALLDTPSTGVGAEIAISLQHNIRVCGFSTKKVSRFIIGMLEENPKGSYWLITDYEEIPSVLAAANIL